MKTISQNLAKFTLLILLTTFLYLPATTKIAFAEDKPTDSQICGWVNNQNGSLDNAALGGLAFDLPPKSNEPSETPEAKKIRIAKNNEKYSKALADKAKKKTELKAYENKIVVITEEPLGPPLAGFSTNCSRLTKCSWGKFDMNNPEEIRRCFTVYAAADGCKKTSPSTPPAAPADPKAPTEYCEIVQIYFSDGGTSLLYGYVGAIYRYFAILGGFIAVLALIIAGVMRSAAGDNTELVGKANQLVTRIISGLVVLFLSAVILYTINPNFFTF